MGATLQVEAERELPVRQPAGPAVDGLLGEEVRQRKQDARQTDEDDGDDLPAFEVQHLSTDPVCHVTAEREAPHVVSLAVSPLPRTSMRVDFRTRTRMVSESSTSTSSEVSEAFVTLPMNPPEVMTVSPRRT